jgi:hypothetical protein
MARRARLVAALALGLAALAVCVVLLLRRR